jgi:hypothetical protein
MSELSPFTKRFVTVSNSPQTYVIVDKLSKEENVFITKMSVREDHRTIKGRADEICRIMNVRHDDYLLYLNEISLYVVTHKQDSYRMFRIYKNNYTKRIKS